MAFALSKLVQFFAQPLNLILALLVLGFVLSLLGLPRLGWLARALAVLATVLVLMTPLPEALMLRLENRFAAASLDAVDHAAGAIILGGSTDSGIVAAARDTWILNESAERAATIVAFRTRRPDIPIIHSGGTARVFPEGHNEAEIMRRFLDDLGVDPETVRFEDRSRNTYENARFTAEMLDAVEPETGPPWLLVTSAWHMPRAIGAFRKAGLNVTPYPVDYWAPEPSWRLDRMNFYDRLRLMTRAMMEYVGLAGYRLTGRSDELFPAPQAGGAS